MSLVGQISIRSVKCSSDLAVLSSEQNVASKTKLRRSAVRLNFASGLFARKGNLLNFAKAIQICHEML